MKFKNQKKFGLYLQKHLLLFLGIVNWNNAQNVLHYKWTKEREVQTNENLIQDFQMKQENEIWFKRVQKNTTVLRFT